MYRLDECNYKSFSARDFKRVLKKNGYKKIRQTGSHEIYKKDNRTISVPGIKLNRMIARRLIKENNLEV